MTSRSWSCRTEMELGWKQNTFSLLLQSDSPVKAKLTNGPAPLSIMLPITTLKWCLGPSGWTPSTRRASQSKRRSVLVWQMLQDFWWQWWGEHTIPPVSASLRAVGEKWHSKLPCQKPGKEMGAVKIQNSSACWAISFLNRMLEGWL